MWDPDVQPVNFGAEIEIGPGNTVLDKSKLQEARSAQPAEIPQAPFKSRDPPLPSTEVDSLRTQIDDFRAENERLRLEVFSLFDELVRMQTSATENTDLRTTIRGDIEIMEPLHSSSFLGEQVSAKVEPAEATVVIAQFEHRILELEAQLQASHSELYLSKALVVELEQEKAQYEIQMTQCQSARENQMREYANLLQQEKGGLMEMIATLSGDLEVLKQTQVIVRESALFEVPPSSGLQTPALSGRTPVNIDAADMWSTFSEAAQHNAVGEDFGKLRYGQWHLVARITSFFQHFGPPLSVHFVTRCSKWCRLQLWKIVLTVEKELRFSRNANGRGTAGEVSTYQD